MAEIVDLGSAEGRLCGELAAALARYVAHRDKAAGSPRRGALTLEDGSGRDVRAANALLEALGVAVRDAAGHGVRLAMHAVDMPDALAAALQDGDPRVRGVIETFLTVACGYDSLSDARTPFAPPAPYLPALRALARLGYARRIGADFCWTDHIGPAMRAAHLWDESLQSNAATGAAALSAEAETAWRTMPDTIRRAYFAARPVPLMDFVKVLARSWKSGQWHSYRADARFELAGQVDLARRIIALADEENP
jgi:hypothetical protein